MTALGKSVPSGEDAKGLVSQAAGLDIPALLACILFCSGMIMGDMLGKSADLFLATFRRMPTANAGGLDRTGGRRRKDLGHTRL